MPGTGAAGGLAGGLLALGAEIVSGLGAVAELCTRLGPPVAVIAGEVDAESTDPDSTVISLVARFGRERALADPESCVIVVATELIRAGAAVQAN